MLWISGLSDAKLSALLQVHSSTHRGSTEKAPTQPTQVSPHLVTSCCGHARLGVSVAGLPFKAV